MKIHYDSTNKSSFVEERLFLEDIPRSSIPDHAIDVQLDGCVVKAWQENASIYFALEAEDTEDPSAIQDGYVSVYQADRIKSVDGYVYEPE